MSPSLDPSPTVASAPHRVTPLYPANAAGSPARRPVVPRTPEGNLPPRAIGLSIALPPPRVLHRRCYPARTKVVDLAGELSGRCRHQGRGDEPMSRHLWDRPQAMANVTSRPRPQRQVRGRRWWILSRRRLLGSVWELVRGSGGMAQLRWHEPHHPQVPLSAASRRTCAGEPPPRSARRAAGHQSGRSRAAEWRIDPKRIGIVGFSAGCDRELATATGFGKRLYRSTPWTRSVAGPILPSRATRGT